MNAPFLRPDRLGNAVPQRITNRTLKRTFRRLSTRLFVFAKNAVRIVPRENRQPVFTLPLRGRVKWMATCNGKRDVKVLAHECLFCFVTSLAMLSVLTPAAIGQEKPNDSAKKAATNNADDPDSSAAVVTYPRDVAVDAGALLVVDLDLPGIWRIEGEEQTLYVRGTKYLRKPMNRPWCVVPHPKGGILVGDSATREVYAFDEPKPDGTAWASDAGKPLTGGYIGIPMAIAVGPDEKTIYVGDAEKRAVFAVPIEGGKSELVARVNARGLSFDDEGNLWAVTPDAEAVYRIDVKNKTAEAIVKDRPYQFPSGLVWAGDHGYVSDVYGKSIWKFTADGKTEPWFGGDGEDTLGGPVGMAANDKFLFVADPKKKQTFQIDRKSKKVTLRMKQ